MKKELSKSTLFCKIVVFHILGDFGKFYCVKENKTLDTDGRLWYTYTEQKSYQKVYFLIALFLNCPGSCRRTGNEQVPVDEHRLD